MKPITSQARLTGNCFHHLDCEGPFVEVSIPTKTKPIVLFRVCEASALEIRNELNKHVGGEAPQANGESPSDSADPNPAEDLAPTFNWPPK